MGMVTGSRVSTLRNVDDADAVDADAGLNSSRNTATSGRMGLTSSLLDQRHPFVDLGHVGFRQPLIDGIAELGDETRVKIEPAMLALHVGIHTGERAGHGATSRRSRG